MALTEQNFGSYKMKFSLQDATKMRLAIENVSKVPNETKVMTPCFNISPECPANIAFEKCPDYLYVYISTKSNNKIKIERVLILSDCNHKKLHEERDGKIFSLVKGEKVDLIGSVANISSYDTLTNDTLIIDLCIIITEIVGKKINRFLYQTDPGMKLKDDFKTMLQNPAYSDVSLQVGDERIPAHWLVLSARSPYFKRMFDSQMKERAQNSVTITDVSICTVKNLIHFLYTSDFDEEGDLFDLYYAADKYEVMDLRTLCACKIMNDATVENACRILQLAHRHNDKAFKLEAVAFIQLHFDAVLQTEGWKTFEASEPLAAELFNFFCSK